MSEAKGDMVAVCYGCHTPMEEADRPVYDGPMAALQAVGLTTRCRYCRELRPPNPGITRKKW